MNRKELEEIIEIKLKEGLIDLDIAAMLNLDIDQVGYIRRKLGYKSNFLFKPCLDNIINDLKLGISCYRIGKTYKCSHTYIRNIAKQLNIKFKPNKERRIVKHNPFENLEDKNVQYWLGFLGADGCTIKGKVSLSIQEKDLNHLRKYCDFLKIDYKYIRLSLHHNKYKMCAVTFCNSDIQGYLDSIGFTERKTFTYNPNFEITWDFLRGYFDGDGSISDVKRREISFVSASNDFVVKISDFLKLNNIDFKLNKNKRNFYSIRISSKPVNLERFINLLYKDAQTYLDRKFDNAAQIRNYLIEKRLNSGKQHQQS